MRPAGGRTARRPGRRRPGGLRPSVPMRPARRPSGPARRTRARSRVPATRRPTAPGRASTLTGALMPSTSALIVSRSVTPGTKTQSSARAGIGLPAQDRGFGVVGAAQVDVGARVDDDWHAFGIRTLTRGGDARARILGVAQQLAAADAVFEVAADRAGVDGARDRLADVGRRLAIAALEIGRDGEVDGAGDAADGRQHALAADHLAVGEALRGRDRPRGSSRSRGSREPRRRSGRWPRPRR